MCLPLPQRTGYARQPDFYDTVTSMYQCLTSCPSSASTVCPSCSFSNAKSPRPQHCDGRRVLSRQAPSKPRTTLHDSSKYYLPITFHRRSRSIHQVVGIAAFVEHIARLRSWNEPRRTVAFAFVSPPLQSAPPHWYRSRGRNT